MINATCTHKQSFKKINYIVSASCHKKSDLVCHVSEYVQSAGLGRYSKTNFFYKDEIWQNNFTGGKPKVTYILHGGKGLLTLF